MPVPQGNSDLEALAIATIVSPARADLLDRSCMSGRSARRPRCSRSRTKADQRQCLWISIFPAVRSGHVWSSPCRAALTPRWSPACSSMPATTSSASRSSSTTMAKPPTARGPAAPDRISTTPAGWQRRWASRTTFSTTSSASRRPSSTVSPRATSPARRRCPVSPATRWSSSTTCSTPPASSALRRWRPGTTSPAASAAIRVRSIGRPTATATRATSSSPPPRRNSTTCASRSAP